MDDIEMVDPNAVDRTAYVQFYKRSVQVNAQSIEEGKPSFVARDYVKIVHPGGRDVVERAVKDEDKQRWPRQWAAYQNSQEQAPEGTLLSILLPSNPEMVDALKAKNFHTVEQVAGATDSQLQGLGLGARDLHNKAKRFLEQATSSAGFQKSEARIAELEAENERLKGEVKDLGDRLKEAESEEASSRRRGKANG